MAQEFLLIFVFQFRIDVYYYEFCDYVIGLIKSEINNNYYTNYINCKDCVYRVRIRVAS